MNKKIFILGIVVASILAFIGIGFAAWGIIQKLNGSVEGEFTGYTVIDLDNITNENSKQAFLYNENGLFSDTGLGNTTSFTIQLNAPHKEESYNLMLTLVDDNQILDGANITSMAKIVVNDVETPVSSGNASISISNINPAIDSNIVYLVTYTIETNNTTYPVIYSKLSGGQDEFVLRISASTQNGSWTIDKKITLSTEFQSLMPVTKPTALTGLVYNGTSQILVNAPDNGTLYSLDITNGTNAGIYNITATLLLNGYCWSDSNTDNPYSFTATIAKKIIVFNDDEISTKFTSIDNSKWSTIKTLLNGKTDRFLDESNNIVTGITGLSYSVTSMTDNNNTYNNSTSSDSFVHGSTYRVIITISLTNTNYSCRAETKSGAAINNNVTSFIFKYKTVKKNGDSDYNYTIEDAISSITSGIIETCPGGESVITYFTKINGAQTYTLQTKLRIPFADVDMDYHGSGGKPNGTVSSNGNTYEDCDDVEVILSNTVYSALVIPNGVTINSSKDIIVGGLIASCGNTNNRGVIKNNGIININSSTLGIYGFIKGSGHINCNGSTKVIEVFRIFDWGGGQVGAGMYSANLFPVNMYSLHNCSCTLRINYGASLEAFWNIEFDNKLYCGFQRGDKVQNGDGNVKIISSTNNGLFNLSSGYIEKSAEDILGKTYLNSISGSNQVQKQMDIVNIHGNCSDGTITLKIESGASVTMTNANGIELPISYMHVNITSGISSFAKCYKFLPGTYINVESGATLNVNSGGKLFFYGVDNCYNDEGFSSAYNIKRFVTGSYYSVRNDAYAMVNGSLNIKSGGFAGGLVKTSGSTGILTVSGNNYATIKAIASIIKKTQNLIFTTIDTAEISTIDSTTNLKGNIITGIDNYTLSSLSIGTWNAHEGNWYQPGNITITILDNSNIQIDSCTILAGQELDSSFIDINDNKFNKEYYIFDGLYIDIDGTNSFSIDTLFYCDTIIYAVYHPDPSYSFYKINIDVNGGITDSPSVINIVDDGSASPCVLPTASKTGYSYKWIRTLDNVEFVGGESYSYSVLFENSDEITLQALWIPNNYKVTISSSNSSTIITRMDTNVTVSNGESIPYNTIVRIVLSYTKTSSLTFTIKQGSSDITYYSNQACTTVTNSTAAGTYYFKMPAGDITITSSSKEESSSCLLPNTLVTMADGTYKEIQYLVPGDMVMVFNHETGKLDIAPVTFNEYEEAQWFNVIHLVFDNGANIGVISEHGFFDLDTMKYEYIDESNYQDFIGHRFYTIDGTSTTLIDAYVEEEYTMCYSLPTYYHLNLFTEDILSMPGGITGLFNIFEYSETLQYDQELMEQDINTYGLFTVEELEPLGVTEEMFNAYAGKYLKVALGKGILTEEYLMYLIERYGHYTE